VEYRGDMMLKRIVSALVGLPILLTLIHFGGMPLFIGILVTSLIGLREFYNACKNKALSPIKGVGYVGAIALITIINFTENSSYIFLLFFVLLITLNIVQLIWNKFNFVDISITFYSLVYVPLLLSSILLITKQPNNIVVWLVFTTAWGTDTFAYFSGYFFGKRKLCPSISPKKTVEGAIGGVLGSMIISAIFGYLFLSNHMVSTIIIGCVGSLLAQAGDLTASCIKRFTGIKDFGNIMPGHGGVLDRFDSILFTAPTIYFVLTLLINRG